MILLGVMIPRNRRASSTTARLCLLMVDRPPRGMFLIDTRRHQRRCRVHDLVESSVVVGRQQILDAH